MDGGKSSKLLIYVIITASIFAIFASRSAHPDFVNSDIVSYERMVQVFRGHGSLMDVPSAFRYRIMCPALASVLPYVPFYSLRLVSLIFAVLTGIILIRYLQQLGFTNRSVLIGGCVFFFSTPFNIWGTQPLTDTSGLFFIVLILYGLLRKWNMFVILLIISIGALTRETILFMIISFYMVLFGRVEGYKPKIQKTIIALSGLMPISVEMATRYIVNAGNTSSVSNSIPIPKFYFVLHNVDLGLTREFYIALLIFLPFVLIGVINRMYRNRPYQAKSIERSFLRNTSVGPILMISYVFCAGWLDGRQAWVLFPVLIPLALFEYERFRSMNLYDKVIDRPRTENV